MKGKDNERCYFLFKCAIYTKQTVEEKGHLNSRYSLILIPLTSVFFSSKVELDLELVAFLVSYLHVPVKDHRGQDSFL